MKYWLCSFLVWVLMTIPAWAQTSARSELSDFERFKQRADDLFRQGDYKRAKNLYTYCAQLPSVSLATEKALQVTLNRVKAVEQMRFDAESRIRANDFIGARLAYEKILNSGNNPDDPIARAALLKKASTPPTDLEQKADQFFAQRRYEEANQVLRLIPYTQRSPAVIEKLRMSRELPRSMAEIDHLIQMGYIDRAQQQAASLASQYRDQASVQELVNRTRKYDDYQRERQKAETDISSCRFGQADLSLRALRRGYPEFNAVLSGRIDYLQRVQTTISHIQDWQSEPAKRAQVLQAYAYLYRASRACILNDYFEYVLTIAREQMNNERYADAIVNFERAKSISGALAFRNRVQILADSCRSILTCRERMGAYRQLLAEAGLLYRQCEVDSAIHVHERATLIMQGCSLAKYMTPVDENAEQLWQKRKVEAIKNKVQLDRFGELISQANKLLEGQQCAEAKRLYQQADSIQVDCRQLDKTVLRIAECDACLKRQCYDSLLVQADRSQTLGYHRDVLRFLREALNCPAPADQVVALNERIAYWECRLDPTKCPPPPVIPDSIAPQRLTRFAILAGTTYTRPHLLADGKPVLVKGETAFLFGGRLDYITFKGLIDLRAEGRYSRYSFHTNFENSEDTKDKFAIDMLEIGVGLKIHAAHTRPKRLRPFGSAGLMIGQAIRYKQRNFSQSDDNVSTLHSPYTMLQGGIGIEQHTRRRGLSLELVYQLGRSDFFNGDSARVNSNPFNFSTSIVNGLSLVFSFRFW